MKLLIVCTLVIFCVVQGEYPSNLPKCKNGDNSCQSKAAVEIIQKFHGGLRDINLLQFEPLHVKSIVLERVPSSPVNVEIKFKDVDILGLKDMQVKSLSGLNADFSGRNVFEAVVPQLELVGLYTIDGRVIILPITGKGPVQIVAKNMRFKFSFDLKPVEKDGETHATLEHVKLELNPEHVFFHFENLFNGDKLLGDNMNKFINDNWTEFYNELSPGFSKAISLVVKSLIHTMFEKYPYKEYFL